MVAVTSRIAPSEVLILLAAALWLTGHGTVAIDSSVADGLKGRYGIPVKNENKDWS